MSGLCLRMCGKSKGDLHTHTHTRAWQCKQEPDVCEQRPDIRSYTPASELLVQVRGRWKPDPCTFALTGIEKLVLLILHTRMLTGK